MIRQQGTAAYSRFSYNVLVPKYLRTGSILPEMFDNVAGFGESHFV